MEQNEYSLNEKEKNMLVSAYENINEPDYLKSKIISAMQQKNLLQSNKPVSSVRYMLAAAAAIIIFFAGWFVSSKTSKQNEQTMASSSKKQYMLLLHNTEGFINDYEKQVKEYGDWFRQGFKTGTITGGDELGNGGWMIQPTGYTAIADTKNNTGGQVSGYFVIEAASDKEAITIAQQCPHLKYNGSVELRAVVRQ